MFTMSFSDHSTGWNNSSRIISNSSMVLGFNLDADITGNSSDLLPGSNGTTSRNGGRLFPRFTPMHSSTRATVKIISYYTCPAILTIGVLSNLLAYLVFTRTKLRKVPSVPYLAAMAVVDSGALITEFIMVPLSYHGISIIARTGVCQYVTFLNYVFIFLCMWYPVALSVEKFITVYYPLRKAALCTPFRAKIVVIGMSILSGVCYYYVIYMFGPILHIYTSTWICGAWTEFHKAVMMLMKLDSIVVNVLPFIVLMTLMVLICGRGWEYYRISSAADLSINRSSGSSRTASTSTDSPVRVTNVVFPVVIIMLLFKLPTCIMRFTGLIFVKKPFQVMLDLQPVFLFVGRIDWAVKLYVYLIFSSSFRRCFTSFFSSTFFKVKSRCCCSPQTTDDDSEVISPRIYLADRMEAGHEARARLMASADV